MLPYGKQRGGPVSPRRRTRQPVPVRIEENACECVSLPKTLSGLEHSLLESSVKCTLCCWVWKLTEHPSGGDYRVSRDQASFRTSRDWAFLAIISRRAYLLALAMRSAYIGGEDRCRSPKFHPLETD